MFGFKKTSKGMFSPIAPSPKATALPCGSCPRIIMKEREPHRKYIFIKDKPMCAVCRIMKNRKMRKEILSQKKEAIADLESAKEYKRKLENERIDQVSAESGKNFLKDLSK